MTAVLLPHVSRSLRLIDNFLTDTSINTLFKGMPPCDVAESENSFLLNIDLPGVDKSDIDIDYQNGVLTITAKREARHSEQQTVYHIHERMSGSFKRSFIIKGVNADAIEANYDQGVLTVHLPKMEEVKSKKIAVTSKR